MITSEMLSSVQALYVAYYGRPADPAGLKYWASQADANGGDLSKIIGAFSNTPEATALQHGASETPEHRIDALYTNLLGRDADPAGMSYWKGQVDSGKVSLDNLTVAFIKGAESDGDAALVQSKLAVANAATQSLAADALSNTVQELYLAYYGRPADVDGLKYWEAKILENGGNLSSIIGAFSNTPEAVALYGASVTIDARIDAIYENLLGRHAEQGGLDYWRGQVESGAQTLDSLTLAIMNGAQGNDLLVLQNKLAVASAFTALVESSHESYSNGEALAVGRTLLNQVTGEPDSLKAAMDHLPAYVHTAGIASADPADFATLIKGGVLISTDFVSTTLTQESLHALISGPVVPVVPGGGGGGGGGIPDAGHPGKVVDGYLDHAKVERIDANGNVVSTVYTDAYGNFTGLTGTGGVIRISGGTDITTGQAFTGELRAPGDSGVVTPLTSLIAALGTDTAAITALKTSLGLTDLGLTGLGLTGVDLLNADPFALAASGDLTLQKLGVQVATLLQAAAGGNVANFTKLAGFLAAKLALPDATLAGSVAAVLAEATVLGNTTDLSGLAAQLTAIAGAGSLSAMAGLQAQALLDAGLAVGAYEPPSPNLVLTNGNMDQSLAVLAALGISNITAAAGVNTVNVAGLGTDTITDIDGMLNFDPSVTVNLGLTSVDDGLDGDVDGTVNLNTSLAGLAGLGIDSIYAASGSTVTEVNVAGFGTTSFASIAGLTFADSLVANLDLTDADFALDGHVGDAGGVNLHTSLADLSGLGIDSVSDASSNFDSVVLSGGLGVGGLGAIASLAAGGHLPDFSNFAGQAFIGGDTSLDINLADAIALIDAGLSFAVSVDDATMMIDSSMIAGTELGHTATLDHLGDLGVDSVVIDPAIDHLHVDAGVADFLGSGTAWDALDTALKEILAKFENTVLFENEVNDVVCLDLGENDVGPDAEDIATEIKDGIVALGIDEVGYLDTDGVHHSISLT